MLEKVITVLDNGTQIKKTMFSLDGVTWRLLNRPGSLDEAKAAYEATAIHLAMTADFQKREAWLRSLMNGPDSSGHRAVPRGLEFTHINRLSGAQSKTIPPGDVK